MKRIVLSAICLLSVCVDSAEAQSGGAVAPLMKLLQSGKLPPERRGTVVEMICTRGGPEDLAVILSQTAAGEFDAALQLKVLNLLTDAALVRKQQPAGDLSAIEKLVHGEKSSSDVQRAAIRLSAIWKVPEVVDELIAAAQSASASQDVRVAAVEGLATFGDERCRATLAALAKSEQSAAIKAAAAAALAKLDLDAAAVVAAAALAASTSIDDVGPLVDAFLQRKGGAEKLAAAVAAAPPSVDAAKLALRYMYSVGRSDAALSDVLSKAAGISADVKTPTPEEVKRIVAEVAASGDATRGEAIFRRADLSCMKCHAVSRAGGSIGPDLSAVGSISPVDYLVNSILDPNLAIKEQFVTRIIITNSGETFTGIVIDRDDTRVRLKDAAGKMLTIAVADIDEEAEGRSLMPQGLTKFLTRQELLDLAKFLSELGKPGPFAIRKTPTIQRWRVLRRVAPEIATETPNVELFREHVLAAPSEAWSPAYARVAGTLPLGELAAPGAMLFLQGEIEVVEPGHISLRIEASGKPNVWLDAEPVEANATISPAKGTHRITVRVPVESADAGLLVELSKPTDSKAQFDVVGGN